MAEFRITDDSLTALKDKVILITGASSGIGLGTTKLLLSLGAHIIAGDLNPIPASESIRNDPKLTFQTTNVTSWSDLSSLFKLGIATHGRIDHVFANAGITSRTNYLVERLDPATGDLLEPDHTTLDINLKAVVNTTALALHYLRKQESRGSIVLTASASSFQRFRAVDYTTAKHGVLGLMRGLAPLLGAQGKSDTYAGVQNVRINAIAPSWTNTGIVPGRIIEQVAGVKVQEPLDVARSVADLFADTNRHGQLIYSVEGRYSEIEEVMLKGVDSIVGDTGEEVVMERLEKASEEITALGKVD